FATRSYVQLADPPADRGARSAWPLYHAWFGIWPPRALNAVAAPLDRAAPAQASIERPRTNVPRSTTTPAMISPPFPRQNVWDDGFAGDRPLVRSVSAPPPNRT